VLVPVAAVLVVLVAAVAATAAIPDANGVIHGCRSNKTGALRVIDSEQDQTCGKDEAPLTWNQTGTTGLAGPAGPTGHPPRRDRQDHRDQRAPAPGWSVGASYPFRNAEGSTEAWVIDLVRAPGGPAATYVLRMWVACITATN
jgi:hypothetical protein